MVIDAPDYSNDPDEENLSEFYFEQHKCVEDLIDELKKTQKEGVCRCNDASIHFLGFEGGENKLEQPE